MAKPSTFLRLALLSLVALTPSVRAGEAPPPLVIPDDIGHCVWMKISARASGYEFKADDAGLGPKHALKADCYMQLVYMAPTIGFPHGSYGAPLICAVAQTDVTEWEATLPERSYRGMKLADLNVIATDNQLAFKNIGGDLIEGYTSSRVLFTVDKKTGAFKSAKFETFGGQMQGASLFNETFMTVVGGFTAKGTSVPVTKVPQAVQDLAENMCP